MNTQGIKNADIMAMLTMKSDIDEILKCLRELVNYREKLVEQLEQNNHDCDILMEVFSCGTKEDFEHLIEEFFPDNKILPISPKEEKTFGHYVDFLKNYEMLKTLGICIYRQDPRTILLEFLPPPNYKPPDLSLIKMEEGENGYKLIHFLFPTTVPIDELQKKYLDVPNQEIPSFIHFTQQYLWCFWKRDMEVSSIKNADFMKTSNIYYNKDRTVISFTAKFLMKFTVEIKLLIHPLSFIAYSVKYQVKDEIEIPKGLADALDELKDSLLLYPLSPVLFSNFGPDDDTSLPSESASSSVTTSGIF